MTEFILPKWSQMRVIGKPITPSYASEIIRRTDLIFHQPYYSHIGYDWLAKTLGMPNTTSFTELRQWQQRWGLIYTDYVHNDWISSSFIYGANGWCHPDGSLYFQFNIGKWPAVSEVVEDWQTIANAFPDLCLDAMLMDKEDSDPDPNLVCAILVRGPKVVVHSPIQYETYWHTFGKYEIGQEWKPKPVSIKLSRYPTAAQERYNDNFSKHLIEGWVKQMNLEAK